VYPKFFYSWAPIWLQKISTDPHILAHIQCPDDRYSELKIYISELTSDIYKYISVAYITMYCLI